MGTRTSNTRVVRHRRVRGRVGGTAARPRLAVYRSSKHLRCQLVDDVAQRTLLAASDTELKVSGKLTPVETARGVGKLIADKAKAKGVTQVVFDRGGYAYHGRIQALAEGAREGGLIF